MNKSGFFEILNDNSKLKNFSVTDIDEIISEYSYFQIPYLLKAKLLYDEDNFKYDNFVKIASIHVNDRAKLYNFIHNNLQTPANTKTNTHQTDTTTIENEKNIQNNDPENNVTIEKNTINENTNNNNIPQKTLNNTGKQNNNNTINKQNDTKKTLADEILNKNHSQDENKKESIADKVLRKIAELKKQSKKIICKPKK